jgi:hypothetical protein
MEKNSFSLNTTTVTRACGIELWSGKLKLLLGGLSIVILLALAGCGGGGSSPSTGTQANPVPAITSILPTSVIVGGAAFDLTITGTGFVSGSVVQWNGSNKTTSFVSSSQLRATIGSNDISTVGTFSVSVVTPTPGGGNSNAVSFDVQNPTPVVTSITPTSAVAGQLSFSLIVKGLNFISGSAVQWNGASLTTSFNSSTQLTATVPAANLTSAGTAQIRVFNPAPGGGNSNATNLPIVSATPVKILTTVLPASGGDKSYYFILSSSGGAYPNAWSVPSGSMPPSLILDPSSGLISGTVSTSAAGTNFPFTVQVRDSLATAQTATQSLNINVISGLPRNDAPLTCGSGTDVATAISNGRLRASISPFGDVDVYAFHGKAGSTITLQTYADRLDLFNDGVRDSYLDTFLELLDNNCTQLAVDDDIYVGPINTTQDSLIQFTLKYTGTYYIRVRDLRGDGRPDLIYDLSISGAD